MLEDPPSTHNIISPQPARDLRLTREQITIMDKVPERQHKQHQTEAYSFNLMDTQGTKHEVRVVGMDSIAVEEEAREVDNLVNLFQGAETKPS